LHRISRRAVEWAADSSATASGPGVVASDRRYLISRPQTGAILFAPAWNPYLDRRGTRLYGRLENGNVKKSITPMKKMAFSRTAWYRKIDFYAKGDSVIYSPVYYLKMSVVLIGLLCDNASG
jgi:hypothetical protein